MATTPTPAASQQGCERTRLVSDIVAKSPAIFWTTDTESHFTSIYAGELGSVNVNESEYLTRSVESFFQDPKSSAHARDAHFLAISGESCGFDFEFSGRDFQAQVAPLRDASARIIGVAGIALDQTERVVAQRALRISERNYRLLIEEAPHAICRSTRSGNLLQVNAAMQEMLQYSETDLLVRDLSSEVFSDSAQYVAFIARLMQLHSLQAFEAQWVRSDGQIVHVSLGGRAVYDSWGELLYIDLFAENISERKQLEEQLRHAQKMQAIGQLAGGIAHDFNNLLTVIRGQAEMIGEELLSSDPLLPHVAELERAAERAAGLTRQLLAFSRKQVLQPKVIDLNDTVANMTKMLGRLLTANIELIFRPDPTLFRVRMDPGQTEQVLMNLAVNARDAMPQGGRLVIETHNVSAESVGRRAVAAVCANYVLMTIQDTGHGMDSETKARMFEPFFTTKQVGEGTGLGLSVVYGVIKQSGGHIDVESRPGEGTVFRIYLPATDAEVEPLPEVQQGRIARGTETLLLVEDDEAIRHMLASFLHGHGYHVLVAADGTQAEQLAETWPINLVLSDMRMPRMGGRELVAKLRKVQPDAKFLLMSGHPEDPQFCPEETRFLQKPFSTHTLSALLREMLDGTGRKEQSAAAGTRA